MASRKNERLGSNLSVTVASGDSLDVRQFTVHERLSSLFRVSLVVLSENHDIDFEAVVGQPARFIIQGSYLDGAAPRFWSGICSELYQLAAEEDGLSTYHLDIVPTLWLATQRRNYRMFQQKSELKIALKLLSEWGIEPVKRLSATYKKRKYRVQYGESDFAFLCRMLEDAGISFYFHQEDGETQMVLTDAPQVSAARAPISYKEDVSTVRGEYVTSVRIGRKVRPGRYVMRDHDYRKDPKYKLSAGASVKTEGIEQKLERYHYTPGAFLFGTEQGDATPGADDKGKTRTDEAEAALLAQRRLDAKRGDATTCSFETNASDLAPGVVASFTGHPRSDLGDKKRWLIIESTRSGSNDGEWSQSCEARSAAVAYRPPLVTPKPRTMGVESATVVGPPGEEIHTDEFGRVRVHFHWDRESAMDDSSSCWIHVSQPWGGSGYGGTNLPRVGQEVLVDFLGGDPDRPIIVGRVFTNLQKTPYKLPDSKTQSGWKSNSTGGTGGYNEIMFEDSGGKELFRMQAERDMNKLVKHDEQSTVGRDRTRLVKRNESVTVGGSRTQRVKLNEQQVVGLNQTITVGVNRAAQVGSIDSTIVGDTYSVMVSPPGEGGGGSASTVIKDKKIVLSTGAGAKIEMKGSKITLSADTITLKARKHAFVRGKVGIRIESSAGDVGIKALTNVNVKAGVDAVVNTGAVIKLNCE